MRRSGLFCFKREICGWWLRCKRVALRTFGVLSDWVVVLGEREVLSDIMCFWLNLCGHQSKSMISVIKLARRDAF